MAVAPPDWTEVLAGYASGARLATRARGIPFDVTSSGSALIVTPLTGTPRRVTQRDFDRHWDAAAAYAPGTDWRKTTRNSSYLEAIAHDLSRRQP